MRLLNYCFLIGGILIASCVGNSSNKSQNDKKINPADTNLKEILSFLQKWHRI